MKHTFTLLAALLLAPLALNAGDSTKTPLDTVPFTSGKEGYACYRCPTLAVSTQGTVLAFCEGRVNSHQDEDDMDVVLKRSTDGGRTWGPLQVLANDGRNPCKCQCPVVLPSGRILLVWLWNKWVPSKSERATREVYVMCSDIAVMPGGGVGVLYERGDLDETSKKSERYDEIGFTVVPFADII